MQRVEPEMYQQRNVASENRYTQIIFTILENSEP